MRPLVLLSRWRRVARGLTIGRWPRVELAVKAALAATLAWQIAMWLPFAPVEAYPYYAPLGALVASNRSVSGSVRGSLQSVSAIIAGAGVAVVVQLLVSADWLLIPLFVAGGILLAGLRVFGDMRSWVATTALFVLIIGSGNSGDYIAAYTGLTLLGALIAVLVATVLPTVPLAQSTVALQRLASMLAEQLDDLADGLAADDAPTKQQWRQRSHALAPLRHSLNQVHDDLGASLTANRRARRARSTVQRHQEQAVLLEAVAVRVEDLTDLVLEVQSKDVGRQALGVDLRLTAAETLRAVARTVRALTEQFEPRRPDVVALRHQVRRLSVAVATAQFSNAEDEQTAGAMATGVRRCLGVLDPDGDEDDVVRPA